MVQDSFKLMAASENSIYNRCLCLQMKTDATLIHASMGACVSPAVAHPISVTVPLATLANLVKLPAAATEVTKSRPLIRFEC